METETGKTPDPQSKSKSKSRSRSYNRRILLRGNKGSTQPLSIIMDYLDDLPVKCNIEQLVKEFLIHRYLPLALKKDRGLEADGKLFAYESIRFFQGIIDAIKEAFDIQDKPATPVVSLVIQSADVHAQEDASLKENAVLEKGGFTCEDHDEGHSGNGHSSNGHSSNGHFAGVNQAQNLLGLYRKGDV